MDILLSYTSTDNLYEEEIEFQLTVEPVSENEYGWFNKEEANYFWSKNGIEEALGIELDTSIWTRIARAKFGELQVELMDVSDSSLLTSDIVAVITDDSNRLDYYLA